MEYRQSRHLKADSLYGAQCALSCPQVHMNERRADIIRPCILVLVTLSRDEICPFGYSPSRRKTTISKEFSARSQGAAARCHAMKCAFFINHPRGKKRQYHSNFCAEQGYSVTLSRDEMCLFLSITLAEKKSDIEKISARSKGTAARCHAMKCAPLVIHPRGEKQRYRKNSLRGVREQRHAAI